jgi:hypothetical protein
MWKELTTATVNVERSREARYRRTNITCVQLQCIYWFFFLNPHKRYLTCKEPSVFKIIFILYD